MKPNFWKIIILLCFTLETLRGQSRKNKCECGKAKKPKLVENKMKISYNIYKEKTKQYMFENKHDRVVNGFFDNNKPWSAQLYHGPTKTLMCGGAIINTRYVV